MTNDAHDTAQALVRQGHDAWVLCTEDETNSQNKLITEDTFNNLKVIRLWLGQPSRKTENHLSYFDPRIGQVVQNILAEQHADILHVWNFSTLTSAIIPAAHSIGIPVVYKATDYGATCWRYLLIRWDGSLCDGTEELLHCLECCKPWSRQSDQLYQSLTHLNPELRNKLLNISIHVPGWKPWVINRAEWLYRRLTEHRRALSALDLIIAPSTWMKHVLLLNGIPDDKIIILPYAIRQPAPTQTIKTPSGNVRFGYFGRIDPSKGVLELIQAFNRLPQTFSATLQIYGAPATPQENLYAGTVWAAIKNNQNIRIEPVFSSAELSYKLQNLDILVVPSKWYENNSLVILEALAHKTPVITSDVAGNQDFIHHDLNSLVYPVDDLDVLYQHMERCITDPELVKRLASNACYFQDIDNQARELIGHYKRILNNGNYDYKISDQRNHSLL